MSSNSDVHVHVYVPSFLWQFSKSVSEDQLAGLKESVSSWTAGGAEDDEGGGGASSIGPLPPPPPPARGPMIGPMIGPMPGPSPVSQSSEQNFAHCAYVHLCC